MTSVALFRRRLRTAWLPAVGGVDGVDFDSLYDNVVLLSSFNGVAGRNYFINELGSRGPSSASIPNSGNAQLDTARAKFGSSSLLLDGNQDFVNLVPGGGNILGFTAGLEFTIDCWIYPTNASVTREIFSYYEPTGNLRSWRIALNTLSQIGFVSYQGTSSTNVSYNSTETVTLNQWNHIAITRDASGVHRTFVNGVGTVGDTFTGAYFTSQDAGTLQGAIGIIDDDTNDFVGSIDEFRILVGEAKWTDDFTPPTAAYSREYSDPDFQKSMFLLGFEGADAASVSYLENAPVWDFPNTCLSAAVTPPLGYTTSLLLNGAQRARLERSEATWSDCRVSTTGDWCFECWIYPTTIGSGGDISTICGQRDGAGAEEFTFYINANGSLAIVTFNGGAENSTVVSDAGDIQENTWYHVCAQRVSGTWYLFIDGVPVGTPDAEDDPPSSNLGLFYLGRDATDTARDYFGHISEVRLTRAARYNILGFDVPTVPFPRNGET